MASTTSPTLTWSGVPKVIAGRFVELDLSTARSVSGSVPTMRALRLAAVVQRDLDLVGRPRPRGCW